MIKEKKIITKEIPAPASNNTNNKDNKQNKDNKENKEYKESREGKEMRENILKERKESRASLHELKSISSEKGPIEYTSMNNQILKTSSKNNYILIILNN